MTTVFTGNPEAITWPRTKSITGITNATPMIVTSAAHGFQTHNRVAVSGVVGLESANGTWRITRLSANTFSLNSSTAADGESYVSGGSAVNYSLPSFSLPSDGDAATAGAFNTGPEALGDQAQFLIEQVHDLDVRADELDIRADDIEARADDLEDAQESLRSLVDAIPAINFPIRVASGIGTPQVATYAAASRRWYIATDNTQVYSSPNLGLTWGSNEVSGVAAGTEQCRGIAVDTSGNVVVSTATNKVLQMPASTGTWTLVTLPATAGQAAVVYDPVHSLYCLAGTATSITKIFTSANRTTWTARTASATLATNYWTPLDLAVNPTTGRIVMVAANNPGNTIQVATSDDGGVTWTDRVALTISALPDSLYVTHDPTSGVFLLSTLDAAHTKSEVWRSTDQGVSWTKMVTLTSAILFRPAPVRSGWLALARHSLPGDANAEEVVLSADNGASWKPVGFRTSGAARGVFSAQASAGAVVLTDSTLYLTGRLGEPTFSVLT